MKHFLDLFESFVEATPDKVVYVEYDLAGRHIYTTMAMLHERMMAYARSIALAGVQKDSCVLLMFSSSVDFMSAFFACHYTGVYPVPLEFPRADAALMRWENYAENARAQLILTSDALVDSLSARLSASERLRDLRVLGRTADGGIRPQRAESDIGLVLYTSGSTGHPKGVLLTQDGLVINSAAYAEKLQSDDQSIFMSWMPYYHVMGLVCSLLTAFYRNSMMVLMSGADFLSHPLMWLRAMADFKVGYSIGPNFAFKMVCSAIHHTDAAEIRGIDLRAVQYILSGGEIINVNTILDFYRCTAPYGLKKGAVSFGYGQTEATACISIYPLGADVSWVVADREKAQRGELEIRRRGTVTELTQDLTVSDDELILTANGTRMAGHRVYAINDRDEDLGQCRIGEIVFSGPSLSAGYLFNEAETKALFGRFPDGTVFSRSGDIGFISETGEVFLSGRKKDMIILKGLNYYPDDIEFSVNRVSGADAVYGTCAFAALIAGEERMVILKECADHSEETLKRMGRDIENEIQKVNGILPYEICFVPKMLLDRTGAGKIKRRQARLNYENGMTEPLLYRYRPDQDSGFSSSDAAAAVRGILARRLKKDPDELPGDLMFTQMGLGSLALLDTVELLRQATGVYIPMSVFFEENTIDRLVAFIRKEQAAQ